MATLCSEFVRHGMV